MRFVVNAHGVVFAVDDDLARVLLESGSFRAATEREIRAWYESQGLKSPRKGEPAE